MTRHWICYTSTREQQAFHKVRTLVRFCIDNGEFKDLEVIELADKL